MAFICADEEILVTPLSPAEERALAPLYENDAATGAAKIIRDARNAELRQGSAAAQGLTQKILPVAVAAGVIYLFVS